HALVLFLDLSTPPYTSPLSLHDALPISKSNAMGRSVTPSPRPPFMYSPRLIMPVCATSSVATSASVHHTLVPPGGVIPAAAADTDRKSTRLNSSHEWISYAVFCLKKKTK